MRLKKALFDRMQKSSVRRAKLFKAFWADHPVSPAQAKSADVMILDALLSHPSIRVAVVIDGQKGLQQAILQRFPQANIQRCIVHVERFVRTCVSRNPQTEAGKHLWYLVRSLWKVRSQERARSWIQQFASWQKRYAGFLAERSRSAETGRWWYTHRKLRAARSHLNNALPYLFTFIEVPGVPRTSNHVEGGVNARLKELLRQHRGLSAERKRAVAAFFLASKTDQNPTQKVT